MKKINNLLQKYNYNFKNLISLRFLLITFFFITMIYGGINDYIYNSKYYGKEAIIINNDIDILNNSYAKIEKDLLKSHFVENVKTILLAQDTEQFEKQIDNQSVVIRDSTFKYLKVVFHDGNSQTQENLGDPIYIEGKISKNNEGYIFDIGKKYIPNNDGNSILFILIAITIIYLIIMFNNIATLKNKIYDNETIENLSKNDYETIINNIKNNTQKHLNLHVLINKVKKEAFKVYKKNLSYVKNIDIENHMDNEVTLNINLKKSTKKLKNIEIYSFFEQEYNNIALITAYIMNILIKKQKIFTEEYEYQNKEKIEELEKIIISEKSKRFINKLKKEAEMLYEELLKNKLKIENLGEYLEDYNDILTETYLVTIINSVTFYRFIEDDFDFTGYVLILLNPLNYIIYKFKNLFK
ncbi:MAG: hypothetical protein PHS49_07435 [Candidatus Gracilibacteria bacterium]|nr:hypothetical protein [Candidatus Gracilibacteria bacterium]